MDVAPAVAERVGRDVGDMEPRRMVPLQDGDRVDLPLTSMSTEWPPSWAA